MHIEQREKRLPGNQHAGGGLERDRSRRMRSWLIDRDGANRVTGSEDFRITSVPRGVALNSYTRPVTTVYSSSDASPSLNRTAPLS